MEYLEESLDEWLAEELEVAINTGHISQYSIPSAQVG